MKRGLLVAAGALVLGIGAAEYLGTSFSVRAWLGHVVRRGDLQALVGHRGIYENDVGRAGRADLFAVGAEESELEPAAAAELKRAALQRLVEEEKLNRAAAREPIDPASVTRETQLLRDQFRDEKSWQKSLGNAGLSGRTLAREVTSNLRDRAWLEKQIANRISPNESEVQRYYAAEEAAFQEPLRLRASHLFLAAPEGYPEEVIARQRALIEQLAERLGNGESFPALIAEFSEDEATKKRDGDLGYFAARRMLPAVFAATERLRPGQISAPIRSRLGFHLIRLTETRPARALGPEADPEIISLLENQKRAAAVAAVLASQNAR
ncbi:MAG: peptidylprolyl isomerase [Chthoniobacterales bacterium]